MENYFFLENYVTSEGAVSHNVLYYQPLPITRHQERFYANNYFEYFLKVSTAFNPELFESEKQSEGVHLQGIYPTASLGSPVIINSS